MKTEKLSRELFKNIDPYAILKSCIMEGVSEIQPNCSILNEIKFIINASLESTRDDELDKNLHKLDDALKSQIIRSDEALDNLSGITKNQIAKQIIATLKDAVSIYVNYLTYHSILANCSYKLKTLHNSHVKVNPQAEELMAILKAEIENSIAYGLDYYFKWFNYNNVAMKIESLSELQMDLAYDVLYGKQHVAREISLEDQGIEVLTRYVCEHANLAWQGAAPNSADLLYTHLTRQIDNFAFAYLQKILDKIFSRLGASSFQQKLVAIEEEIKNNELSSNETQFLNNLKITLPDTLLNDGIIKSIYESVSAMSNKKIMDDYLYIINQNLVNPENAAIYSDDLNKGLHEIVKCKSMTLTITTLKSYLLQFAPVSEAELKLKQAVLDWLYSFDDEVLECYKPFAVYLALSVYRAKDNENDNELLASAKIIAEQIPGNFNQKCAQNLKDTLSNFIRDFEWNKLLTLRHVNEDYHFKNAEETSIEKLDPAHLRDTTAASQHFREYAQLIDGYNFPECNDDEQFSILDRAMKHLYLAGVLGDEDAKALLSKAKLLDQTHSHEAPLLIPADANGFVQQLIADKLQEIRQISPLYKNAQMKLALFYYGKRYQKIYVTPEERFLDLCKVLEHFMNVGGNIREKLKESLRIYTKTDSVESFLTQDELKTAAYKLLLLELNGNDPFAYLFSEKNDNYPFKISRPNVETVLDKGIIDSDNKSQLKDFYLETHRCFIFHQFKNIKTLRKQNGYFIQVDAEKLKELKDPTIFVDADTQEEVGRFYRKANVIHFDGFGNNIELKIDGTLEEECYEFDSKDAELILNAKFNPINSLNIISHAKEVYFKGTIKCFESTNIETNAKINISQDAQIESDKHLYVNAVEVDHAGQILTGSAHLKLEGDLHTTTDSHFTSKNNLTITSKGNIDLHGRMTSKESLEILSKEDINLEHCSLNVSDCLSLSGKSMHAGKRTKMDMRNGLLAFAKNLNIDKDAEMEARDITLAAQNIDNQSSGLEFYKAKIHASNQFINHQGAALSTSLKLALSGNCVLNQGKIFYGDNLEVNVIKDFVNGASNEEELQKLMKENINPAAEIIGKDANITAHTCANLYGEIKTHNLNLTSAVDINYGIYKTSNANKKRIVNIDAGYNLTNMEACSADIYKYLNRIRNHNYQKAFQKEQEELEGRTPSSNLIDENDDYVSRMAAELLPTLDSYAEDDYRSGMTSIANIKNSTLNTFAEFNTEHAINIIDKFKTAHMEGTTTFADTHVMLGEILVHDGVDHSINNISFINDRKENGTINAKKIIWDNGKLTTSEKSSIKANTAFIKGVNATFNGTEQSNNLILDFNQLSLSNTSRTKVEKLLEMHVADNILDGSLLANNISSQATGNTIIKGPIKTSDAYFKANKVDIQNDIVAQKTDNQAFPKVRVESKISTYLKRHRMIRAEGGSVLLCSTNKITKNGDVEAENYIATAKEEYLDNGKNKAKNLAIRSKQLNQNGKTEVLHAMLHGKKIRFTGILITPKDVDSSYKPVLVFKSNETETTKESKIENPQGTTFFVSKEKITTNGTDQAQKIIKISKKNINSEERATAQLLMEKAKQKLSELGNTQAHITCLKAKEVEVKGMKNGDGKGGARSVIATNKTKIDEGTELSGLDAVEMQSKEEIVNDGKVDAQSLIQNSKNIKNNKEILVKKLKVLSQNYSQRGLFVGGKEDIKARQANFEGVVRLVKSSKIPRPLMKIRSSLVNMKCDIDAPDATLDVNADEINLQKKLTFKTGFFKANRVHDNAKINFKDRFIINADVTEMSDESKTNGEGLFELDSHKASLKNIISNKIILKLNKVPHLEDLLRERGIYSTIHARKALSITEDDDVYIQNDMVLPISVIIRAPNIILASNIYGQKNLGLDAYRGKAVTLKDVMANNDLLIQTRKNYNNYGSLSAGNAAYFKIGKNLKNIGGKIFSPRYVQIEADGNVINEVICSKTGDERNPVTYKPGRIKGGTGENTNGLGLYLKAKNKFINNASEVYSLGSNYIDADQGIISTAKLHQYLSYHKKWRNIFGRKETKEYKYHVQKPIIYSLNGKNILRSDKGGLYSLASDLFAKDGNDIYVYAKVNLLGFKIDTVCNKKSTMIYNHSKTNERDEYNVPTYVIDYGNTCIHSQNDINLLNASLSGPGDLILIGKNVILSQPKLEHSYKQKSKGFEFRSPHLSMIPGYSIYLDAQEFQTANNNYDRGAALWNTGVDATNTFNDALTIYLKKITAAANHWPPRIGAGQHLKALFELCAPTAELGYKFSDTKAYTETLPNNTGIQRGGSLYVKTQGKLAYLNGVPVVVLGNAQLDSPCFIQEGAQLISSNKFASKGVSLGIGFGGTPVGINDLIAKERQIHYANQQFLVAGTLVTNIGDWQMKAANTYANKWTGKVGSLSIITPRDKLHRYSTDFKATTSGLRSIYFSKHRSKTISMPSSITIEGDLNTKDAPLYVDKTYLEGAKILSGGVNRYKTDKLVAKDVKQIVNETRVGVSGNFSSKCSEVIPHADTKFCRIDNRGTQQSTIFGAKGTYPEIKKLVGNLNIADANGYKIERLTNFNHHLKVPFVNISNIVRFNENLRRDPKGKTSEKNNPTLRLLLWNRSRRKKDWAKVLEDNCKQMNDKTRTKGHFKRTADKNNNKSLWPKELYGNDTKITLILWDSHIGKLNNELSLTGHMSYVITRDGQDTAYSFDLGRCTVDTNGQYIREQKYRNGYALKLNFSHEDASKVASWFRKNMHNGSKNYCHTYNFFQHNCAAPIQDALRRELGLVIEPVEQGNNWVAKGRGDSGDMHDTMIKGNLFKLSDLISFNSTGRIIAPTRFALSAWSKGLIDKNSVTIIRGCQEPRLFPVMQNDKLSNPWRAKVLRTIDNCSVHP